MILIPTCINYWSFPSKTHSTTNTHIAICVCACTKTLAYLGGSYHITLKLWSHGWNDNTQFSRAFEAKHICFLSTYVATQYNCYVHTYTGTFLNKITFLKHICQSSTDITRPAVKRGILEFHQRIPDALFAWQERFYGNYKCLKLMHVVSCISLVWQYSLLGG